MTHKNASFRPPDIYDTHLVYLPVWVSGQKKILQLTSLQTGHPFHTEWPSDIVNRIGFRSVFNRFCVDFGRFRLRPPMNFQVMVVNIQKCSTFTARYLINVRISVRVSNTYMKSVEIWIFWRFGRRGCGIWRDVNLWELRSQLCKQKG